jgi:FKBP-type peptidyl-prolyl cis-trans isomerase 2
LHAKTQVYNYRLLQHVATILFMSLYYKLYNDCLFCNQAAQKRADVWQVNGNEVAWFPAGKEIIMPLARNGSTVTIRYIGTLDNGKIFTSTDEHGPLTIAIGADQLFPALEQAIIGMRAGGSKNIIISAADAYGPRLQENIISVDRSAFPVGKEISVGQKLSIDFSGGVSRVMVVAEVNDDAVTLDGNHPLAGLDLAFALSVDRVE